MRYYKIILLFLYLIFITGCNSSHPADVSIEKLTVESMVLCKNQDITEVNITIRNETGYEFLPSGVFLKPYIMTKTNDNTYKKEHTPILLEAVLITSSEDKKCLTYKVFLSNSFLQPLQFLEQNSFDIDIRGYFLNQKGIIINSISGYGGVIEIK